MKGQLKVATQKEYLAKLKEPRRTEVTRLQQLVRKTVPNLEPVIIGGILGFGPYHYKYASGREGDSARIGISSNASYISLYIVATNERGWLAEQYRDKLPKANIGKSCVRFKKLDDLDLTALKSLLKAAAKPGVSIG